MPVVSVVIPTYNRADLLPRAIESALGQTVEDIEVIVVDDASTDQTPAVAESYTDPRVKFLRHDENRNGAAARNTGIDAAEGEYIAFLDSDDEWLPTKLERQLDHLQARSDEWIAVYCGTVDDRNGLQKVLYECVTVVHPSFDKRVPRAGGAELIADIHADRFSLGGTSTLLVERDAVEAVGGFDPSFPRHQDREFLVRLLRIGRLAVVPDELVVRHSTGMPRLSVVEEAKRRYFEKFADDIEALEANGTPVRKLHRFSIARYQYQRGQFVDGTRSLLAATAPSYGEYLRLLWSMWLGLRRRLSP